MRRSLLKPSMLTLFPFRKIQTFSNIKHKQDVLHANAEKVIGIMRTQQRRKEIAIRGNLEYSDLSISWPIAPSIAAVEEGAISATRCIHIRDGFLPSKRCAEICSLVASSNLQHFFTSDGERKVVLSEDLIDTSEEMLGATANTILLQLKEEVHIAACSIIGKKLVEAGSILSWLSKASNDSIAYKYWDAHCDKANNFEYDVSVLLYLNSDFSGGEFVFMDDNIDRVVQIRAGRLLLFDSTIYNIHRVERVLSGDRMALSIWYSYSSSASA